MPPRRVAAARRLTAPSIPIFVLSLLLAGFAVASFYVNIPFLGRYVDGHRFAVLAGAYVVLALGVIFAGI